MKRQLPLTINVLATLMVLTQSPLHAHHGQEFFLLYDATLPAPNHGIFQGNFSFIDEGDTDSLTLSPSLSLGLLPRTVFNLRADFADEARTGWAYRSIEPGFQFDLTPPNLKLPLRLGLSFSYQFSESPEAPHHEDSHRLTTHSLPATTSKSLTTSSTATASPEALANNESTPHDHSAHDHPPAPATPSAVDLGPDAPTAEELAAIAAANSPKTATAPPSSTPRAAPSRRSQKTKITTARKPKTTPHSHAENHSHSHPNSIHNHDDNLFSARFIAEVDLTSTTLLVANLITVLPESGDLAWGYALGLRQRLTSTVALGIEALGDFDAHLHQEAIAAVFWEPTHHLLFKLGAGTGLSAISPDATLRAGVLWKF